MAEAEAVVVAEAAEAANTTAEARLWQAMATLELPAEKCQRLWDELRGSPDAFARLAAHPALSPLERDRVASTPFEKLAVSDRLDIHLVGQESFSDLHARAVGRTPAVFVIGDWSATHGTTIGIVGTRGASAYGKAASYKFAEHLARAGMTIVSGGALGIDAEAHRGALKAGGKTVAVLSGGVDWTYPRVHASLFSDISSNGCLVSQFAVGARPEAYRFLIRNRLIAALSRVILVVEAPERSGALSTASAANDLARDVYVVPANIDMQSFRGSHSLLRDGAILVDHPEQILQDLGLEPVKAPQKPATQVSPTGSQILGVLTVNPTSAESICEQTGLSASEVLAELTILEMEGEIHRDGGGYAVRL